MNVFDIVASAVIVFCIGMAFKYRWLWLVYSVACLTIAIVDFFILLYGQAVMNLIICGLAINNFCKSNETVSKHKEG